MVSFVVFLQRELTLLARQKSDWLNPVLFFIIVLVIVFAVMVSSYFHKRHHEFNMGDIEKAVRGAYPAGVRSITKDELVKGVKKHFHCSSKDAHYIIGVARRKKLVDIAANHVTLL